MIFSPKTQGCWKLGEIIVRLDFTIHMLAKKANLWNVRGLPKILTKSLETFKKKSDESVMYYVKLWLRELDEFKNLI